MLHFSFLAFFFLDGDARLRHRIFRIWNVECGITNRRFHFQHVTHTLGFGGVVTLVWRTFRFSFPPIVSIISSTRRSFVELLLLLTHFPNPAVRSICWPMLCYHHHWEFPLLSLPISNPVPRICKSILQVIGSWRCRNHVYGWFFLWWRFMSAKVRSVSRLSFPTALPQPQPVLRVPARRGSHPMCLQHAP